MHSLRKDPPLPSLSSLRPGWLVVLAVSLASPVAVTAAEVEARAKPGKDAGPDVTIAPKAPAPAKPTPAKSVKLPPPGVYPASEILPLVGVLTGRVVQLGDEGVKETKVKISKDLAGSQVTLTELTIVLAAAHVFLFTLEDPKEGEVIFVSRNPDWRYEPPRHTRIIEASPGEFERVAKEIQAAVEKRNSHLPQGAEPIVVLPAKRSGKIFVSSPRKEDMDLVEKYFDAAVEKEKEHDKSRPRLYTYQGEQVRAAELRDALLEELTESERQNLRVVVASRGNRLYYRCPEDLARRVREILVRLDVPDKKGQKPPQPGGGTQK